MCCTDLALIDRPGVSWWVEAAEWGGMVRCHVGFYEAGVGAGRGLPSGLFDAGVEVIGEVLAIGVADFPVRGKARFGGDS